MPPVCKFQDKHAVSLHPEEASYDHRVGGLLYLRDGKKHLVLQGWKSHGNCKKADVNQYRTVHYNAYNSDDIVVTAREWNNKQKVKHLDNLLRLSSFAGP